MLPKAVKHQKRGLDRTLVERLALERYTPAGPYWASNGEAAEILGISRERVARLVAQGRLPVVVHDGRSYYRWAQIEVIGNARESRRLQ